MGLRLIVINEHSGKIHNVSPQELVAWCGGLPNEVNWYLTKEGIFAEVGDILGFSTFYKINRISNGEELNYSIIGAYKGFCCEQGFDRLDI